MLGRPALLSVVGQHGEEGRPAAHHLGCDLEMKSAETRSNSADAVSRSGFSVNTRSRSRARSARRRRTVMRLPSLLSTSWLLLCSARPAHADSRSMARVQQARVVVDQRPVLLGAEQRCGGAQVRAGAAADIQHGDWPRVPEVARKHPRQLLAAGVMIGRLAQVEPAGVESAHGETFLMTSAMIRAVSSQRGSFWPAAQAASPRRRRRADRRARGRWPNRAPARRRAAP